MMKKSLLRPACVFLALGALTTGEAMADTALPLVKGWNLVSSATPVTSVATTFGDPAKITSVWAWDANSGNGGKWRVFLADGTTTSYAAAKGFAELESLSPSEGFWVNSVAQQTIAIVGGVGLADPPGLVLVDGWNLVGVNAEVAVAATFGGKLSGEAAYPYASVWKWESDGAAPTWSVYLPGEQSVGAYAAAKGFGQLATINPGDGFWVNVNPGQGGEPLLALQYDAVLGENIQLPNLLFAAAAEANATETAAKWTEIDAFYEQLGEMAIPAPYNDPLSVCEQLAEVPSTILMLYQQLTTTCAEVNTKIGELNSLQDVVNSAADYLWQSNNEQVALVDGTGLALVTNEGVATIQVTDGNGKHSHDIVINAQKMVHKVRQLQIQNEQFVTIDQGQLRSFNADGSPKAQAVITLASYDPASGQLVVGGEGALLVAQDQLLTISPCAFFPEGGLRQILSVTDNGNGNVTLATGEGSLSAVIQQVDMEYKEATSGGQPATTQGLGKAGGGTVTLAKGVRMLSAEEFRQALRSSARGERLAKAMAEGGAALGSHDQLLLKLALEEEWNPHYAFSFDFDTTEVKGPDTGSVSVSGTTVEGSGSMSVKGVIGFELPIAMILRIEDWKLDRFKTTFSPTQYADITVGVNNGNLTMSHSLATVKGKTITVYIGSFPVIVTPVFEISVIGSAKGSGVAVKVIDYEVSCEYGVSYLRGREGSDWQPIAHYNRHFHAPGIVAGDYSLMAGAELTPKLKFYGLGGPYAATKIGAKLIADTAKNAPADNWETLNSFLRVNLGVAFDVTISQGPFDYTLVDYERDFGKVLDLKREEWNSNGPYQP